MKGFDMNMIEKVARHICSSMGYDPDGCDDETRPENESSDGWENWFGFKGEARAALRAMTEPTEGMIYYGSGHADLTLLDPQGCEGISVAEGTVKEFRSGFVAAICAALEGK